MATLVFIDTNIFLDFYRLSREAGLGILGKLEQHGDSLITGDQIAMEFKKNRQKVVLDVYRRLKVPDWAGMQLPPILAESKASKSLETHKKGVKLQADRLKRRLQSILSNPAKFDPVYQTVQRLSRANSVYNLRRDKEVRFEVREDAKKRFLLGYPPRKAGDTSIGDAVNWEWMVRCARESGADIVIVSRDSDYGQQADRGPILNDWLKEEFRERVGRKRKILLTDRLSVGLKEAAIVLNKREVAAETALISTPPAATELSLQERLRQILYPDAVDGIATVRRFIREPAAPDV